MESDRPDTEISEPSEKSEMRDGFTLRKSEMKKSETGEKKDVHAIHSGNVTMIYFTLLSTDS